MASPSENTIKKGAEIEISSNDEGFSGSWYEGTVIRPPKNFNKSTNKVLVEYKTLMEDERGTRRLREEIELVNLRPSPPSDRRRRRYKLSEEVDAYCNGGWWGGIITEEVVGNDNKYLVYFRSSREQIDFRASELRVHREWVRGEWVPPLEEDDDALQNEVR
ncbi:hypothetical protein ACJIZ3_000957 [Penstemon smallii]|uniref:Agenet domain-containing protein n=1 Tax=Penstemon smallii TaxID=265156 RepID=A0ABD3U271_9LAMI